MAHMATDARAVRDLYEGPDPNGTPVVNAIAVTTSLAIEEAAAGHRSRFLALLSVVRSALRATSGTDEDPNTGTRGVVVGVIRGACFAGAEMKSVFADVGEAVVKATWEMAGDLEMVTRRLIEGAVEAARKLDVDEAAAAFAAARGALETVEEFGEESRRQVLLALSGSAAGVRVLVREAYGGADAGRGGALLGTEFTF
jgi:hypothetical protein